MKRVFLFLATNLAVIVLFGITFRLSGVEPILDQEGVHQPHLPDQMAEFGVSGRIGQGLSKLFMSHPPLDERIAALKRSL